MPARNPVGNYVQMKAREFGTRFTLGKFPKELEWARHNHFMYGMNRPIKGESPQQQFERVSHNMGKVFQDPAPARALGKVAMEILRKRGRVVPEAVDEIAVATHKPEKGRLASQEKEFTTDLFHETIGRRLAKNNKFISNLVEFGLSRNTSLIHLLHPNGAYRQQFKVLVAQSLDRAFKFGSPALAETERLRAHEQDLSAGTFLRENRSNVKGLLGAIR